MRWAAILAAVVVASGWAIDVSAQETVRIGFLSQSDDPRYAQNWGYARLIAPPPDKTIDGAELAISDLSFVASAAGMNFELDAREAGDDGVLAETMRNMAASGDAFIVLDLSDQATVAVAEAARDLPVTLINATASGDAIRTACYPNMLHTGPSDRMLADAMTQYLRLQNWTKILVLVGEEPRDQIVADAFAASARRLRLDIVDTRSFTLAANPQRREENNIKLLTAGRDYDVVYVADTRGEFSRYIPYATTLARPVIGSTGLTAQAWHWSFERDGATQVSSRFDKWTNGRKMSSADWSVWVAVKAVIGSYARTPSQVPADVAGYMRSPALGLDGSKGAILNFRDWNGQMRMPVLLSTSDAVIAVAPLEGYLHKDNTLDTLGADRAEFLCR